MPIAGKLKLVDDLGRKPPEGSNQYPTHKPTPPPTPKSTLKLEQQTASQPEDSHQKSSQPEESHQKSSKQREAEEAEDTEGSLTMRIKLGGLGVAVFGIILLGKSV
jgi:hypothetical protein